MECPSCKETVKFEYDPGFVGSFEEPPMPSGYYCPECGYELPPEQHPLVEADNAPICVLDWDNAYSIASDEEEGESDVVYFGAAEKNGGWYLTIDLDCNTGGFTETITRDDGPYDTKEEAIQAGFDGALDWYTINWPESDLPGKDAVDSRLHHLMWWVKEDQ